MLIISSSFSALLSCLDNASLNLASVQDLFNANDAPSFSSNSESLRIAFCFASLSIFCASADSTKEALILSFDANKPASINTCSFCAEERAVVERVNCACCNVSPFN